MPRFTPIIEIAPGATVTGNPNGYSWTDLTMQGWVHEASGVTIRRGARDQYSESAADSCALTLLNDGGRFVPRNPLSPFYGRITRGTPLRVLMRPSTNSAADAFNRTSSSSWGSADAGGAWTNTGTASDYSVSTTNGGRHTNNAAATSHFSTLAFSLVRVDVKVRVRVNALSAGGAQQAGVTIRHVDANNQKRVDLSFATSGTITLGIVSRASGTDTVLASTTLSLTHSTSSWYWLRIQTGLTSSRAKCWLDGTAEPAGWTLDGTIPALTAVSGAVGVFSIRASGNTNSAATTDFEDFSLVDGPRIQFTGFVDEWPIRWNDAGLAQAFAPITAFGQLRRLEKAKPLRSAVFSSMSSSSGLVGYWPMEDGNSATSFASASAGLPGSFSNIQLAADSAMAGSDSLPTLGAAGRVAFPVPAYTSSGSWAVYWVMRIPASSLTSAAQVMSWVTPSGSISRWQLRLNPGSPDTLQVDGFAPGGGVSSSSTVNFVDLTSGAELSNGRQLAFLVTGTQNGSNVDVTWTCWYMPDSGGTVTNITGSYSPTATTGRVSLIYHDSVTGFAGGGHTIGHVGLGDGNTLFGAGSIGASGGAGQTTGGRFASLLQTQGITALVGDLVRGAAVTTQLMGAQRSGDVLSQLREVEATESGVLHDSKQGFLELLPRSMRSNRPVDLTLNAGLGQVSWPFEPTDDDYLLRNDITVDNAGGSTAYAKDQTSINLQGVNPDSAQVNIYNGTDLQQHANWRLKLGTTGSGLRYPSIVLDLTRTAAALAGAWFDTDVGSRVQVTNIPAAELPPENLDLVLDGYTEVITASTWTAVLNCSPGSQWLTAVLDSSTPRLDCGACTTSGTLTTTATSVPVAIADACTWVMVSGAFGIYIAGELMTVTAVSAPVGSGSSWTQTLTVTRSVNGVVKPHAAGEEVHVSNPIILAL